MWSLVKLCFPFKFLGAEKNLYIADGGFYTASERKYSDVEVWLTLTLCIFVTYMEENKVENLFVPLFSSFFHRSIR